MNEKILAYLKKMSLVAVEMVDLIYKGFLENDTHYLNSALNKERIMDDFEKEIIGIIVRDAKSRSEKEREECVLLGQIAQNIERMGDEMRSLMERIEIKIAEQLFFSEPAIKEYQEVFQRMRKSVVLMKEFIDTWQEAPLDEISSNGIKIKSLVEESRHTHLERLAQGICQARAADMYFDMLDFTGNIARHCTNIARIQKEK